MAGWLEGRVALVTGGGTGIGRATALVFAREEATVVVSDLDAESGEATANTINRGGGPVHIRQVRCLKGRGNQGPRSIK